MIWNLLVELVMCYFLPPWKRELQEVAPDEAKAPQRPEVEKPGQLPGGSSYLWDREIDGA